jgi:L-lactate dehydrogenase complex protein LldE
VESGAEVLVAGDSSCLMHIGGLLSRQRSGVRVMHLAEVLAATEGTPVVEERASRDPRSTP